MNGGDGVVEGCLEMAVEVTCWGCWCWNAVEVAVEARLRDRTVGLCVKEMVVEVMVVMVLEVEKVVGMVMV